MKNVMLVKYGEIALRGNNRHLYENRLISAIRKNIDKEGYYVTKEQGRLLIENRLGDFDYEYITEKVKPVLGIVGICPCIMTSEQSVETLQKLGLFYMQSLQSTSNGKKFTFKVETKRANQHYPTPSREVSALVGGYILEHMENAKVDVHTPQIILNIELRTNAYIFADSIKGLGGLPVGASGKGMLLLSGGIDSPVAGFMLAKRGVELCAVYFHSPPYTSERALIKVCDLAKRLSNFTGGISLYVVNFTDVQLALYKGVAGKKLTILLKRAMLKIAEQLATKEKCQCLITGDSVGQVASQTVAALLAVNSAASLPIIRPLSGMDKGEIVAIAKQLDTFDISIRPFEDCCTIFVDKHPETKPRADIIEKIEAKVEGLDDLISIAINSAEKREF